MHTYTYIYTIVYICTSSPFLSHQVAAVNRPAARSQAYKYVGANDIYMCVYVYTHTHIYL